MKPEAPAPEDEADDPPPLLPLQEHDTDGDDDEEDPDLDQVMMTWMTDIKNEKLDEEQAFSPERTGSLTPLDFKTYAEDVAKAALKEVTGLNDL